MSAGSEITLADISSVTIDPTTLEDGDVLSYEAATHKWKNIPAAEVIASAFATENEWTAEQAFQANASFGVHGTTDALIELYSSTTYRPGNFWIKAGLGAVGANEDPILAIGYNAPTVSTIPVPTESSIWTGYEGFWYVDPTHQYLEWYVRWRTANDVYSGTSFQTSVEIGSGYAYTTVWGDEIRFSNGAGTTNWWQIIGGTASFTMPILVTGVSDAIQLQVKAYTTQTNPIFAVQDSAGSNYFNIGKNGIITINSTSHATDQIWALTHAVAGSAQPYMYGHTLSVLRDNGGPTNSWTYGFTSTVAIRALTADALSRYAYAGKFTLQIEAASGKTATLSVSGNAIEAWLVKSGAGTTYAVLPHGVHIGDFGGTGSYAGVGVYIEAQTAGTTPGYAFYSAGGQSYHIGNFGLGAASTPAVQLHVAMNTTVANAVLEVARLESRVSTASTGGAAGFGPALTFYGESGTDADYRLMGQWSAAYVVATDTARTTRVIGYAADGNAATQNLREFIRGESSGSAAMLSFYGGAAVIRGAALTAQLTSITHTAPGTPDYALQDLVQNTGFGFATKDEGDTALSVVLNLQTRMAELEARLGSATGVNLFA